nr:hypothetical protein [Tanacetum cinerariifolium]
RGAAAHRHCTQPRGRRAGAHCQNGAYWGGRAAGLGPPIHELDSSRRLVPPAGADAARRAVARRVQRRGPAPRYQPGVYRNPGPGDAPPAGAAQST